jgi:hypothetical protein
LKFNIREEKKNKQKIENQNEPPRDIDTIFAIALTPRDGVNEEQRIQEQITRMEKIGAEIHRVLSEGWRKKGQKEVILKLLNNAWIYGMQRAERDVLRDTSAISQLASLHASNFFMKHLEELGIKFEKPEKIEDAIVAYMELFGEFWQEKEKALPVEKINDEIIIKSKNCPYVDACDALRRDGIPTCPRGAIFAGLLTNITGKQIIFEQIIFERGTPYSISPFRECLIKLKEKNIPTELCETARSSH